MSLPSVFISHGSPQILLDKSEAHDFLKTLSQAVGKPEAIVMISAHWETRGVKIMATETPSTIYDFGGFDPLLYTMKYAAVGSSVLAIRLQAMLKEQNISAEIDSERGLDHGAWVPLMLAFPKADIPVLQISVPRGSTPRQMFDIGRALAPLRDENILIMGSGSLTHNLYEFRGQALSAPPAPWVTGFAEWMDDKLIQKDLAAVMNYRAEAPFAAENHPTEEHLLPLFVAMGVGGDAAALPLHRSYNHSILAMNAYAFGAP